mmetsp:Transcript_42942/g.62929  ORF Transcript_42942/g.62929 Transcript_42942/m.62929 type:complete len:127 (-) Transcript_42942:825-1205(-)
MNQPNNAVIPVDFIRGAPKLYVNSLETFDGHPLKYEKLDKGLKATLGQTVHSTLLENPAASSDLIMETRDKELFFMLTTTMLDGSRMHILSTLAKESGHLAIKAIEKWYSSVATSRTIIDHYRTRV